MTVPPTRSLFSAFGGQAVPIPVTGIVGARALFRAEWPGSAVTQRGARLDGVR